FVEILMCATINFQICERNQQRTKQVCFFFFLFCLTTTFNTYTHIRIHKSISPSSPPPPPKKKKKRKQKKVDPIQTMWKKARDQELDAAMKQGIRTYVKLNVSQSPYVDPDDPDVAKDIIGGSAYISKCWKDGIWKKLFCHKLRDDDWNKYSNAKSTSTSIPIPIPILITLPKHYNPSEEEEEDVIMNALELKIGKAEAEKIKNNKTPIRLFLDGFDEIYDNYKNSEHRQIFFFDRFKLDQWNTQVVITCRSNVLSEDHIRRMLQGYGSNTKTTSTHLVPYSKRQIIECIGKVLNDKNKKSEEQYWNEKRYEETLNKYPNLQMMAKEPYFLLILITQLPQWPNDDESLTKITKWELIEAQCKDWVKDCSQRFCKVHNYNDNPKTADSIIKTKCQKMAIDMHQKKTSVLTIENESSKKTSADRPDPTIDNDEKKDNTYTNSSNYLGNYQYSFPHKLEHELQAAQYIAKQVDETKLDGKETAEIEAFELNKELLDAPGILELLAERAGGYKFNGHDGNDHFVKQLFLIIDASKDNSQVQNAAANAATILNLGGIHLGNKDWKNINIPHANLDRATLEGTTFEGANLQHVSLYQAVLHNVDFTRANMEAVNFGETRFLPISINEELSLDGSKIISVDEFFKIQDAISKKIIITNKINKSAHCCITPCGYTVEIWDTLSGKLQNKLNIGEDVIDVQLSCDGNISAVILSTVIEIWIGSEKKKILKGHTNNIHKVQFSSDGERILFCSSDTILMWDMKKENPKKLKRYSDIVQFSSDGSKIAYLDNALIKVEDIETQNFKTLGHSTEVIGMQFSSDGSKLASYSKKIIRLWDVISGNEIYQFAECYDIYEIQFSSGDSKIVTYSKDEETNISDRGTWITQKIGRNSNGHCQQEHTPFLPMKNVLFVVFLEILYAYFFLNFYQKKIALKNSNKLFEEKQSRGQPKENKYLYFDCQTYTFIIFYS
ncbi:hypothetical protein RFI_20752, partial [Reticulomyxa filosa]